MGGGCFAGFSIYDLTVLMLAAVIVVMLSLWANAWLLVYTARRVGGWRARRRPPEFLTQGQMALREVNQIGRMSGRAYNALFGEPWPHRALRRARGLITALAA